MLPLTFSDAADYDKVQPFDRISLLGLADLTPGKVGVIARQAGMYSSWASRLVDGRRGGGRARSNGRFLSRRQK